MLLFWCRIWAGGRRIREPWARSTCSVGSVMASNRNRPRITPSHPWCSMTCGGWVFMIVRTTATIKVIVVTVSASATAVIMERTVPTSHVRATSVTWTRTRTNRSASTAAKLGITTRSMTSTKWTFLACLVRLPRTGKTGHLASRMVFVMGLGRASARRPSLMTTVPYGTATTTVRIEGIVR
jgi:hypothetical protein